MQNKFNDQMIKQSLNSVFAKYRDLSVSRRSIIIIDLLATDKSRYFDHPRPIIVKYLHKIALSIKINDHCCISLPRSFNLARYDVNG